MKPTVSVTRTVSPPGSWRWRVRGSRVAKSRSSARDPGVGERVEHRGLAGVGVAHQGHLAVAAAVAALALDVAGVVDRLELALDVVDPVDQAPTVDLELGLARAAGAAPCRRPAGPATRRAGAAAAGGTASRASSTCALPSGVRAFWAKMSRITAVRSIAVRPRIFSRLRCWAGLSACSKTTVSASTARQTRAARRPCPSRGTSRRRARRAAGRSARPRRRRRCRTSRASSSSWCSSVVGAGRRGTGRRRARSARGSCGRSGWRAGRRHRARDVTSATNSTGPGERRALADQADRRGRRRGSPRSPRRRPARRRARPPPRRHDPVPQAQRPADPALDHASSSGARAWRPSRTRRWPRRVADEQRGGARLALGVGPTPGRRRTTTWGLPTCAPCPACPGAPGRAVTVAHVDLAGPASPSRKSRTTLRAGGGGDRELGPLGGRRALDRRGQAARAVARHLGASSRRRCRGSCATPLVDGGQEQAVGADAGVAVEDRGGARRGSTTRRRPVERDLHEEVVARAVPLLQRSRAHRLSLARSPPAVGQHAPSRRSPAAPGSSNHSTRGSRANHRRWRRARRRLAAIARATHVVEGGAASTCASSSR